MLGVVQLDSVIQALSQNFGHRGPEHPLGPGWLPIAHVLVGAEQVFAGGRKCDQALVEVP